MSKTQTYYRFQDAPIGPQKLIIVDTESTTDAIARRVRDKYTRLYKDQPQVLTLAVSVEIHVQVQVIDEPVEDAP